MNADSAILAGIGIGVGAWLLFRRRSAVWDLGSPIRTAATVTSGWGDPRTYRDGWHEGLDFDVPIGTPIYAVADGKVMTAHKSADNNAGKHIVIKHAGGIASLYAHLDSLAVVPGLNVERGARIGTSGNTANPKIGGAPHLHFGLFVAKPYLSVYQKQFGKPTTGWGVEHSLGTAVPAEPLIQASYSATVIARGRSRNVIVG